MRANYHLLQVVVASLKDMLVMGQVDRTRGLLFALLSGLSVLHYWFQYFGSLFCGGSPSNDPFMLGFGLRNDLRLFNSLLGWPLVDLLVLIHFLLRGLVVTMLLRKGFLLHADLV